MTESDEELDENSISKSERKRRMIALQNVGVELMALAPETLRKFNLPEALLEALLDAKRINPNKHGGMKRQMQYIGKVMREIDAAPIVQLMEDLKAPSRQQTALHHLAEQWRERLLADATAAGAFLNEFPLDTDDAAAADGNGDSDSDSDSDASRAVNTQSKARSQLDALLVASKAERAAHQPPKSFRLLYKFLHTRVVKAAANAVSGQ